MGRGIVEYILLLPFKYPSNTLGNTTSRLFGNCVDYLFGSGSPVICWARWSVKYLETVLSICWGMAVQSFAEVEYLLGSGSPIICWARWSVKYLETVLSICWGVAVHSFAGVEYLLGSGCSLISWARSSVKYLETVSSICWVVPGISGWVPKLGWVPFFPWLTYPGVSGWP